MTRESGTDAPDEWTPAWLETLRVQRDAVADRPGVELVAVQVGSVRAALDELERLHRIEQAAREVTENITLGGNLYESDYGRWDKLERALDGPR